MDIYSFIKSKDIAEHCRNIGKTWTPFEMAIIIGRSNKTLPEKHTAWRELISDYPDMPQPRTSEGFESLHKALADEIAGDEHMLALLMKPDSRAIYGHRTHWREKPASPVKVITSFEAAWSDAVGWWKPDEEGEVGPEIVIDKMFTDAGGRITVVFSYDMKPLRIFVCCDKRMEAELSPIPGFIDDYLWHFDGACYVDIPMPFNAGDILTLPSRDRKGDGRVFVLGPLTENDRRRREMFLNGEQGAITDMLGQGYFVGSDGGLYSEQFDVMCFDLSRLEYYNGKLEGNNRLLHYVSLNLKGELELPALLTIQRMIMLERELEGCKGVLSQYDVISERLLVENRLTPAEKEELLKNGKLMPWVPEELTMRHVEFLISEFGGTSESVQNGLADEARTYNRPLSRIFREERRKEKAGDESFNPARKDMAKEILDAY